uniref:Uncharacterized protein n=1 Tax=Vitis vinifera TaxID=29760 RepID=F6GWB6_VITVI
MQATWSDSESNQSSEKESNGTDLSNSKKIKINK